MFLRKMYCKSNRTIEQRIEKRRIAQKSDFFLSLENVRPCLSGSLRADSILVTIYSVQVLGGATMHARTHTHSSTHALSFASLSLSLSFSRLTFVALMTKTGFKNHLGVTPRLDNLPVPQPNRLPRKIRFRRFDRKTGKLFRSSISSRKSRSGAKIMICLIYLKFGTFI